MVIFIYNQKIKLLNKTTIKRYREEKYSPLSDILINRPGESLFLSISDKAW